MFGAYVVNLEDIEPLINDEPAKSIYNNVEKSEIIETLKGILSAEKKFLNAEEMCNLFFPVAECPVFLSHSSQNKQNVRKFAQWLKKNFEINAFIDSDLWGCIANLQRKIDAKFSKDENGKYNYKKICDSTAHVHMMLCHALTQMINHAECFIFLKSSASISIHDTQKGTFSPWIFHELATVDTIRRKRSRTTLPEDEPKSESFSKVQGRAEKDIKIFYPVPYNRLVTLEKHNLESWESCCSKGRYGFLLERMYRQKNNYPPMKKWEESLNWLYEKFPPKGDV